MASKRTVATIKQFDYTSKEEFEKDVKKMREKGYHLLENTMYNLEPHEVDDETWKYSAYFIKSDMI